MLRDAKAAGCRTFDGLGMLVEAGRGQLQALHRPRYARRARSVTRYTGEGEAHEHEKILSDGLRAVHDILCPRRRGSIMGQYKQELAGLWGAQLLADGTYGRLRRPRGNRRAGPGPPYRVPLRRAHLRPLRPPRARARGLRALPYLLRRRLLYAQLRAGLHTRHLLRPRPTASST